MDLAGFDPDHAREGVDVAVVAVVLTAGEVVALAEGDRVPHHHAQRAGLIVDVAHLAEGGTVTRDEHRPVRQQSGEHALLSVGHDVARPEHHGERHDRGRETGRAVRPDELVLAQELVQPVFVLARAAIDRMILADGQHTRRRVDHGAPRKDVVPRAPMEHLDHETHVLGVIRAHVLDAVELLVAEHLAQPIVVGAITDETAHRSRKHGAGLATIEDGDVVTGARQFVYEREPVELRATHDQDLHTRNSSAIN